MATVTFYEKPGCSGNLRQKLLLAASGHTVQARDLNAEAWSADRLLAFLGNLEIGEWFNRSAPLVKSGEIVPDNLGFEQALHLLLDNPLLIRRPLMEIIRGTATERCVGFDPVIVDAWKMCIRDSFRAAFAGSGDQKSARRCGEDPADDGARHRRAGRPAGQSGPYIRNVSRSLRARPGHQALPVNQWPQPASMR